MQYGQESALWKVHYLPGICFFFIRAIPCFLAVYFGDTVIQSILEATPAVVISGLTVASKIIPGVGIAVLLLMMLKGRMWIFFFLGFILTTYLGLSVIPVAFIALAFAVIYDMASNPTVKVVTESVSDDDGDGGYDL